MLDVNQINIFSLILIPQYIVLLVLLYTANYEQHAKHMQSTCKAVARYTQITCNSLVKHIQNTLTGLCSRCALLCILVFQLCSREETTCCQLRMRTLLLSRMLSDRITMVSTFKIQHIGVNSKKHP